MAIAAAQVIDRVAALLNDATAAGVRVWTDRAWVVDESKLPCIQVLAGDEVIKPVTVHWPWINEHELAISVVGKVRAVTGVDDAFNDLAGEVLLALFGTQVNATLQPLVGVTLQPASIERRMAEEGEASIASVTALLQAKFKTFSNDPETLI